MMKWTAAGAMALLLQTVGEPPLRCQGTGEVAAHYLVLMMGNAAGRLTSCTTASGGLEFLFAYNDRGRGPRTRTHYEFSKGLPSLVDTSGHDYYKNPVSENFGIRGARAEWSNRVEKGSRTSTGAEFYLGYSSPRAELGLLARALRDAPGQRLQLLPEGEAWLEHQREHTIRNGPTERTVTHYTIKGLGFLREHVWLDEDGRFFALASAWVSVVPEGWEHIVIELRAVQDRFDAERAAELARTLPRKPSRPVALTNARLFDAERAVTVPDSTVVFEGDRITAVGPDDAVEIPRGAEVRNLGGATLLPGLWDMHVHLNEFAGLMNIATGITTVRDLANDPDTLADLRTRFDDGTAIGPHVVAAGIIDGPGPYQGPTKMLVATADEARAAVDAYAKRGYRHVKLYSSLDPGLVPVIARHAHDRGMWVSGHIPASMTAEQAVRAGYDEIQHMNMLFLNFFPDVVDTQTPARFTAVAERAADLDLSSDKVQQFVRLLKERRVVVDPTLSIFEGMFVDQPGEMGAAYVAVADLFPAFIRRSFLDGGLPRPPERNAQFRKSFEAMMKLLKMLHDEGVPIVAGTDALAGFTLHYELELYVRAGIPAPAVLQMATIGAARVARLAGEAGSIAVGKRADLLVVDGDPLRSISDVRRQRLVVKGGVLFEREAIDAALFPSRRSRGLQ